MLKQLPEHIHLSRDECSRYVAGRTSRAEAERINSYSQACEQCGDELDRLLGEIAPAEWLEEVGDYESFYELEPIETGEFKHLNISTSIGMLQVDMIEYISGGNYCIHVKIYHCPPEEDQVLVDVGWFPHSNLNFFPPNHVLRDHIVAPALREIERRRKEERGQKKN